MAALDQPGPKTSGTKPRARKRSFRLDMTPMVDLAFLLLTFFMLTTTFAKPRVMQLTMPAKAIPEEEAGIRSNQAITILLGPRHKVHYYFGLNAPAAPTVPVPTLHTTDFSDRGIRQVLLVRGRQQPAPVVLIVPMPGSKYQDMVNILDEMTITDQKRYAITELRPADRQLLATNAPQ